MMKLKKTIQELVEFGTGRCVEVENNICLLRRLLANLYYYFLTIELNDDVALYNGELPQFDYSIVRKNVELNFPDFGYYSKVINSSEIGLNNEIIIGDEVDDLTDIIIDLLCIEWIIDNIGKQQSRICFKWYMETHIEEHLLNLLLRIKEAH